MKPLSLSTPAPLFGAKMAAFNGLGVAGMLGTLGVLGMLSMLILATPAMAELNDCGQPVTNGANPKASDALFTLQSAVGIETCIVEICDVDGNGLVAAADALVVLRVAVGFADPLLCPTLATTTTSTSMTTTTSSTTTTLQPFATWAEIQPLFATTCSGGFCHTGVDPNQNAGNLRDLDDFDKGYAQLVGFNSTCFDTTFAVRVSPGSSAESYLINKLVAKADGFNPSCGGPMPSVGDALSSAQINGIIAWINRGAPKN